MLIAQITRTTMMPRTTQPVVDMRRLRIESANGTKCILREPVTAKAGQ
jgi:hypothetical protein